MTEKNNTQDAVLVEETELELTPPDRTAFADQLVITYRQDKVGELERRLRYQTQRSQPRNSLYRMHLR